MILTFAGQPLLLEDPEGMARRFLRRHIDPAQNSLFGAETVAVAAQRQNPTSSGAYAITIPVLNYPNRPSLKLNQLYWPGGAMRWACFLGLVNGTALNAIINELSADAPQDAPPEGEDPPAPEDQPTRLWIKSGELIIDDESEGSEALHAKMHVLTPRKITPDAATQDPSEDLYLLPLVDSRYYWQQVDTNNPNLGRVPNRNGRVTWSAVLNFLGLRLSPVTVGTYTDVLNVLVNDRDPLEDYLTPYTPEFDRDNDPPALMLDGAAACLGQRVVFNPPGEYFRNEGTDSYFPGPDGDTNWYPLHIQDPETADQVCDANFEDFLTDQDVTAGAKVNGINALIGSGVPERVRVTFRDADLSRINGYKDVLATDVRPAQQQWVRNSIKVIHSTLYCPVGYTGTESDNPDGDPWTDEEQEQLDRVDAFASQVATDYYAWLSRRYDVTLPGIKLWQLTGYDDAVLWSAGCRPDGTYVCSTRVWTLPYDFGFCTLTHGSVDIGGPWFQVVSHPFLPTVNGEEGGEQAYQLQRMDYVWCLPLPYYEDDDPEGNLHWQAEADAIATDGSSFDDETRSLETFGATIPLIKVYFNQPFPDGSYVYPGDGEGDPAYQPFAKYVGALFPREIFKAASGQLWVESPGAANAAIEGTVVSADEDGGSNVRVQISDPIGSEVLCEKSTTSDTWADGDSVIAWFCGGRYLAANRSCGET